MKALGVILIFASCLSVGIKASTILKKRQAALVSFLEAFDFFRAEIVFRSTPVGEIINDFSKKDGVSPDFFKVIMKSMDSGETFRAAILKAEGILKKTGLSGRDEEIVKNGLFAIGMHTSKEQDKDLNTACRKLQYELNAMSPEVDKKCRLYGALGFSAGMMLSLTVI